MARVLPVLINRSGGTAAALGDALAYEVTAAFDAAGQPILLELLDGADIANAVRRHIDSPVIAVGGGDGTLSAAAAVLARAPQALAILPLGTRNHLARQLRLPLDLAGAARLAADGQRRRIDLGQAVSRSGERVFVNNASFGIYTRFVRRRDRSAWPKWLATVPAAWQVLRHMRAQRFALTVDGDRRMLEAPLLFVGNNHYSLDPGHVGERDSLTDGHLSLYAVAAQSRPGLMGFALRALFGFADPERDFEECGEAREIVVEGEGEIEGAFDGEVADMALPLRLRNLPNALGVVTPRQPAVAARADAAAEHLR